MIYCFVCRKCGLRFEKVMRMKDATEETKCECGAVAKRDHHAEMSPFQSKGEGWPIHSEACAVDPSSSARVSADMAKHGVKCSFDGEGRAVFTSPSQRRQALKYFGMFDKSSYN